MMKIHYFLLPHSHETIDEQFISKSESLYNVTPWTEMVKPGKSKWLAGQNFKRSQTIIVCKWLTPPSADELEPFKAGANFVKEKLTLV